jgi:6-pyruvoyl-tetrahydropterin synthase
LLEITAQIEDEDNEDLSLQDQLDDLVKEANLAYVTRESRRAREQLQSKGAAFFAASAKSWLEWRDRMRKKDPLLDPEASGIPRITRHFLEIPASTNLKKYHDHVHRVLPAFRARCARVLKKHTEDQQYAKMRKHFAAQIPKVTTELEMALPEIVKQAIVEPWSEHDGKEIKKGIKSLFEEKWKHPDILVHGWGKILRENGIPVDGAYLGRNLNEEILETVQTYIDGWSDESTDRAENLAKAIYQPVQDVLKTVEVDLQTCRATPELTDATTEALEEKAEEIKAAYDRLLGKLHDSLDDTHLRFTTEIDIECPIAQTMKPSYKRASDPDFVSSGRGIYNRQRKVLQDSMLRPKRHYIRLAREERIKPLVHTLKEKLVSSQIEVWNQDCMSFVRDTTELLEEFSQTTKDLLMDAAFMKEEHRKAREELKRMLVVFDERLEEVQNEFVNLGPPTPTKKVKVEIEEEPRPFIAPSISNQQNSTAVTTATSDVESVPISQDWGWHHFLANMHPLRSD